MNAPENLPLIGYAVCLPVVSNEEFSANAEYFAVTPNEWAPESQEEELAELNDSKDWAEQ